MSTKIEKRGVYLFIDGKEIKNDIKSIEKEFFKARGELKKMEVGSAEYNKQMQKVGQLKSMMDVHNKTIRDTAKQWNKNTDAAEKNNGVMSKLLTSAKGLLPAFGWGALIAGAVKGAKALFNLYVETAKARREAEKLTGLSGQPLADFTARVQATADTFNRDFNEVLVGVNSFAQTMGISLDEALSKVNDGFLTGADNSGEFLDILKEYGPQLKAAGLSADESIALISQQVKTGIYSDKGIDTIKEGTLRLREMTTATRNALDGIGLSSSNIQEQLRNGTISIFDSIRMVSNRLAELPPQSAQVGTAIADIFGGPGEDAGLQFITMLGTAELSLDKLKAGAGENAQAQERLLEANTRLKQAWSELMGTGTGTLDAIKAFSIDLLATGISGLAQGIAGIRDWFITLYNESLPVRAGIQYMLAMWESGFTLVKTALAGFWEQLKLGGKLVKAVLTFDLSGIKEAFQDYGANMKETVVGNAKKIAESWKDAWNETMNGQIQPVKQYVEVSTIIKKPGENTTPDTSTGTPTGGISSPEDELEIPGMIENIDPRVELEDAFTEAVLESSKLRQHAMDAEAEAARMRTEGEIQLQQRKKEAYLSSLDTIISVFGEETKIGKAALIAKQAYAIAETVINIAKGTGETAASVPFPFNIPMIIGFAAQVATLISTIKSATSKVSGYAVGGFTNGDRIYRAGEAGQEWIAPNRMLNNPVTGPVIQWLEDFRKKPYTINPGVIEAVSPSNRMPAFKPAGSAIAQTNSPQVIVQSDPRLTALIDKLNRKLEEGIHAKATINKYGSGSLDEAIKEIENFKNKVYRK
ncbi:phage tail tape measure protein [Gaoshiqia sediminis]|uniref:Phage tail tape measure protein n=1 Tax=Gaoshiqia sediminis TaxID=2986998 RepID=A0AA41YC39_9BACT|nr:phage tail tape measure protein [Gaoshiqia sediminis]MCW0483490.1 phage tail tape measure protein [Gaoshiqia sediminis]